LAVLDAVPGGVCAEVDMAACAVGTTDEAVAVPLCVVLVAPGEPCDGIASPDGDGLASLLAAHASEARSAKEASTSIDKYLLSEGECMSLGFDEGHTAAGSGRER